jgi:two-component system, OmpR family, sensor histidine kinase TctE
MPREPQKLRSQLLTWLFVPLLLLLIVDTFVSYWVAVEFSRRAYDRSLVEIAREISMHLKESAGGVTLELPPDSRQILLTDPEDRIHFEVSGADGRFAEGEPLPHAEELAGTARGEERFFEAVVRGAPVRVVELRVDADVVTARPAAIVRVAETQLKRRALAREILLSVVIPQALIIVVAGIVVWIGVVHGLSPLERLRQAVAARSHRDWSPIVADDVPAEVRPLLDSINDLVGRLDRALTLQNRFIGDAAHQLKTPVTVLKTQLEVALREDDPERLRLALVTAQTGLERLSRVVSQLLSLARTEPAERARPRREPGLGAGGAQEAHRPRLRRRRRAGDDPRGGLEASRAARQPGRQCGALHARRRPRHRAGNRGRERRARGERRRAAHPP